MLYHAPTNSLILKLRDPSTVTTHIPRSRVVTYKGMPLTQVHMGLDEMRVLRNLGIAAPSPIRHDGYAWPSRYPAPFAHQIDTAEFFTLHNRAICLNDMGTGKSLSALWAGDYLMRRGHVRKAIIVSPMSTMHSVWANEINGHFMFHRTCAVLHGSKERRLKMLEQDVDFYIVNHDGLKVIHEALAKRDDIDLWIIDEAGDGYRNAQTERYKLLTHLLRPTVRLWLMTGTPCPNAPTDAWALARLIGNPKAPKYFNAFKAQVMHQLTKFKWVPKPEAYQIAYELLQPGIRFRKEDCIDLPPVTFTTRECELTTEQRKVYADMHKALVASVQGTPITAANAAVKIAKLLQACVGTIYDNDGVGHEIDARHRLDACADIVREAAGKVLIFVPFTAALKMVARHLRGQGYTVETVDGSTSPGERKRIFDAFQNERDPKIIVAHPKTTAHGLTLTEADTTIWYAPIFSLEIFDQANNRMNRPGQKRKMTVAMLAATDLERQLYATLASKGRMQDSVLQLYKKEAGLQT